MSRIPYISGICVKDLPLLLYWDHLAPHDHMAYTENVCQIQNRGFWERLEVDFLQMCFVLFKIHNEIVLLNTKCTKLLIKYMKQLFPIPDKGIWNIFNIRTNFHGSCRFIQNELLLCGFCLLLCFLKVRMWEMVTCESFWPSWEDFSGQITSILHNITRSSYKYSLHDYRRSRAPNTPVSLLWACAGPEVGTSIYKMYK